MKFEQIVCVIAIIWYILTAWFSSGYIHLDEQYQIIEFAGYWNGWNQANELTWEFDSQIRSSIQPFLGASIFRFCEWINVTNPFHQAFVLRLLTVVFSLFSIQFFIKSYRYLVSQKFWKTFVLLSYFIWFLPYINVRFSSETWSGLFLLLAIGLLIRNSNKTINYWLIGVFLGFSFLFRFQAGIAIATIGGWLIIKERASFRQLGAVSLGFALIFLLGIVLDYIFYGNWTVAAWNYLFAFIDGDSSNFGVSPFYYYLHAIVRKTFTPFGILILATICYAIIKKRDQLVTWVVVVFILVHSMIGHKEFRFLFPILNFLPLFIIWSLEAIQSLKPEIIKSKYFIIGSFVLIGINTIGLVIASTTPPSSGRIETAKQIRELNIKGTVNFIFTGESNPYAPWGYQTNFYKEENMRIQKIVADSTYSKVSKLKDTTDVFALSVNDSHQELVKEIIENLDLKLQSKNVSDWTAPFFRMYGAHDSNVILLYSN